MYFLLAKSIYKPSQLIFHVGSGEKTKSKVSNFYYVGIAGQIATIWALCYPVNKSMCSKAAAKGKSATTLPLSVSGKSLITDLDALSLDIKPIQLLSDNEFLLIKPRQLQESL